VKRPPFLFERYFLIPFVFFLLLVSYVLGALWRYSPRGKLASLVLLAVVVGGNLWHVSGFLRACRGQVYQALADVGRQAGGAEVIVTGDYDFRVAKFCAFYAPYLHDSRPVIYRPQGEAPHARWLFVHRLDERHP